MSTEKQRINNLRCEDKYLELKALLNDEKWDLNDLDLRQEESWAATFFHNILKEQPFESLSFNV